MNRSYPKLMAIKTEHGPSPDKCVVFFADPHRGMVVNADKEDPNMPKFGVIYDNLDPDDFGDLDEDVVVWLTEGPLEPILAAIEMVDKMKAEKESGTNPQV